VKKYRLNIFILYFGLFFALASCTGSSWNPEADLWGKWTYVSSQAGEDFYKQNLEFLEDGQLLVGGNGYQDLTVMPYVIIAPGRIKITMGQQSVVLNYVLSDETLELSFNQGHNRYQGQGDLGSIAASSL